jgi:hypothetical protein
MPTYIREQLRIVIAVALAVAPKRLKQAFADRHDAKHETLSRQNSYNWLRRYRSEGVAGLIERSRATRSHRQALRAEIADGCLAVRREHPT